MRKLACRLGWLDRSIDPLDGLKIGRVTVHHGATAQYVDPRLRPETRQVKAMAAAADTLCGPQGTDPLTTGLPLFDTKIGVAGFGGLRLGEQNALHAIDASSITATSTSTVPGSPRAARLGSLAR